MTTNTLLVATATQWHGAARMARCLAEAGFTVSLLTPQNSPSEKSRFVTKVGHLGPDTTWHQWVHAFAAMVRATAPRVVLPCDDTAVRLMQALVLTPPDNLQPALRLELGSLIIESLGTPAHYRASIDKTLISPAAEALGIRVPAFAVASELSAAQRFALQHGYPVVVKRSHSSAGQGVAICADAAALSAAYRTLGQPDGLALGDARDGELLVQAHIPGRIHYHNSVAWKGVLLAGQASEQLAATTRGPASAVRYYHSPALRAMSATLAAGFGISGVYVPEYVIHEHTGDAYLLEINRRMTHGTHRGAAFGVDLGAALFAAVNGLPSPTRPDLDPGEEHFTVHFPLEWTRDPESRYLREYPVDVPWDEPELFEAIVAQVMANFRNA
jgi:predicted ATP-grasp superfamily ATP-dependent carboligase